MSAHVRSSFHEYNEDRRNRRNRRSRPSYLPDPTPKVRESEADINQNQKAQRKRSSGSRKSDPTRKGSASGRKSDPTRKSSPSARKSDPTRKRSASGRKSDTTRKGSTGRKSDPTRKGSTGRKSDPTRKGSASGRKSDSDKRKSDTDRKYDIARKSGSKNPGEDDSDGPICSFDAQAFLMNVVLVMGICVASITIVCFTHDAAWNIVVHGDAEFPIIDDESYFSGQLFIIDDHNEHLHSAKEKMIRNHHWLEIVHLTLFGIFVLSTVFQCGAYMTRGEETHTKFVIIYYCACGGLAFVTMWFPLLSWQDEQEHYLGSSSELETFAKEQWRKDESLWTATINNFTANDAYRVAAVLRFCSRVKHTHGHTYVSDDFIEFFGRSYTVEEFFELGFCARYDLRIANTILTGVFSVVCFVIPAIYCFQKPSKKVADEVPSKPKGFQKAKQVLDVIQQMSSLQQELVPGALPNEAQHKRSIPSEKIPSPEVQPPKELPPIKEIPPPKELSPSNQISPPKPVSPQKPVSPPKAALPPQIIKPPPPPIVVSPPEEVEPPQKIPPPPVAIEPTPTQRGDADPRSHTDYLRSQGTRVTDLEANYIDSFRKYILADDV